jgi:hypothetical protein
MERTPEHIDPIFRNRLQNISHPPPDFVWVNIERKLRKRNRYIFWWFIGIVAAGSGLAAVWVFTAGNQAAELPIKTPQDLHQPSVDAAHLTRKQEPLPLPPSSAFANTNTTLGKGADTPSGNLGAITHSMVRASGDGTSDFSASSRLLPHHPTLESLVPAIPDTQSVQASRYLTAVEPVFLPMVSLGLLRKNPSPPAGVPAMATTAANKALGHCYDFTKQPTAWLLEAYLGPSLAQRELISSPDNRPYLTRRLGTERRDLAYNVGLRAALMIKGNFLIRTGLHYDQITEIFEYIDPSYVKYLVEIVNQNGVSTIDTVGVEYGEKYQKTFNRLGMLDIPLMAGVELRNGRSGFSIHAGMSFNVLFWKRGAILSPDTGVPASFTPNSGNLAVFRPRTGVSANASVQWFYHLTPRVRLFVEPYFKKVLRPVSLQAYPVQQRYGIGGLRFGCTKILN